MILIIINQENKTKQKIYMFHNCLSHKKQFKF